MFKKPTLICLLFLFVSGNASSQGQHIAKIDSAILVYYQKCLDKIAQPVVLQMADTLLTMAQNNGDLRMQSVALCTKLDHYYYIRGESNNADSIIVWVQRIKDFAKKTNQPKYYYFVWSSRLINYHLGMGEYNIALVEAEKMLKEAEAEDYKEGIADCYGCMTNIYSVKMLDKKKLEFTLKEIEMFEKYNLERYNISIRYASAAEMLINEQEYDKALRLLEKAMENVNSSYHKVFAKIGYISYYLAKEDIQQAGKLLKECRQLYAEDLSLDRQTQYLYSIEYSYYNKIKDYNEALNALSRWEKELIRRKEPALVTYLIKKKADLYWNMEKKEIAGELYRQYLSEQEKEQEKNEEITTGEFATLLDLQKLNAEKKELELLSQKKQLHNIQLTVLFLAVLLAIVIFFLYRQSVLNRKLRKSRDELNEKNRILLKAEDELRKAKEIAEQSSHMKTVFIQNISHEIRTPLNSIVGFSAVLADLFSGENEDIMQFASLIEENSQLLLKLVGDILDISDLDDDVELEYRPVNVNTCCVLCIEETKPMLNDNVEIIFNPGCAELTIESNLEKLLLVLSHLLSNAAKFTQQGKITLGYEIREAEKQLLFTVTDTGIGIPLDEQEHIFERFVKLNEFTQGTGLGLPISRVIAEKMGGYLILDKEYTEGTRFVFCIRL